MAENNLVGLREPLARVRGLGSAGHGTEHWWSMRVTSLLLVPLVLWLVISLLCAVLNQSLGDVRDWIENPWVAIMLIANLGVGFWHAAQGVQTVIEDYVHTELVRMLAIIAVKAACALAAGLAILSVLKIAFGG